MNWPRASILASLRVPRVRTALIAATAVSALTIPAIVFAGPSNNATVWFGNPNAPSTDQNCFQGAPGQPPEACANAFHKLIPGAVTIRRGESVIFELNGFHQVAIYSPGKRPNDIQVTSPGFPPQGMNRVNDPNGRVLLQIPPSNGGTVTFTTNASTQPGRYLVICNIATHFQQNMWGWVNVQ